MRQPVCLMGYKSSVRNFPTVLHEKTGKEISNSQEESNCKINTLIPSHQRKVSEKKLVKLSCIVQGILPCVGIKEGTWGSPMLIFCPFAR